MIPTSARLETRITVYFPSKQLEQDSRSSCHGDVLLLRAAMVTVTPVMSRYVVTSQERGDSGGEGGLRKERNNVCKDI